MNATPKRHDKRQNEIPGRNSMKNTTTILILLIFGMILGGGCASLTYSYYDGPRQPKTEVGMIKAGVIYSIGGKDISFLANRNIEVPPGSHSLGLSGTTKTGRGEKFDFDCI